MERAWPSFMRAECASHLVERMKDTDPLRLREGAARRLRQLWFLVEPDRAFCRAVAVCAESAMREPPPEDLAAWALSKIDLAIEQLVRSDRVAERAHPELLDEEENAFPLLTECLMLDPKLVRAMTVEFNALDALPRRAFYELLIEGREVADVIESGPWDEDGLHAAIQTALAPFGLDARGEEADDPSSESEP